MDAYPGMPVNHYAKLIGEKWRNLTEDEKKPWYEAAAQSQKTYQIEISEEMKLNGGKKLPTKREFNRMKEQLRTNSKKSKAFGA